GGWLGILAPANTPRPIVQRLRDEVAKAVAYPDVIAQLDSQGMQPRATQPDEWRAYLKSELERYTKIIKEAGIKPEQRSCGAHVSAVIPGEPRQRRDPGPIPA